MSCRVATFAEIHSTKDIDICRKFNDIIALGKLRAALLVEGAYRSTRYTK